MSIAIAAETPPQDHRGRGICGMIVGHIEALAREKGLTKLVLETGDRLPLHGLPMSVRVSLAVAPCSTIRTPSGPPSTKRTFPPSRLLPERTIS